MAYTKFNADWKNANSATGGGDETTPITEAALDHFETGIDEAHTLIDDHIADGTAAHAGSAVSVDSTNIGNSASTTVQGTLEDLDNAIETLQANPGAAWQIVFTALCNEPPATAYATLDTRNSHPVLDFDAGANEDAVFRGVLSPDYAGSGINVKLIWAATSATSGNVVWHVYIERINASGLDIDADGFGTNISPGAVATDGVSGETTETTIAISDGANMDSLAAGEMFRLRVRREGTVGTDTMAGDAELIAVVVTEQ